MPLITIYSILPNSVFGGESIVEVENAELSPIPSGYTHESPYPIPDNSYAYMDNGWKYQIGNPPPWPEPPSPQEIQAQNKAQAELFLQQTDWTATVDINNPTYSNPYLGNQNDFLAYRGQIRQIAVNPPETPIDVWPTKPDELWINV